MNDYLEFAYFYDSEFDSDEAPQALWFANLMHEQDPSSSLGISAGNYIKYRHNAWITFKQRYGITSPQEEAIKSLVDHWFDTSPITTEFTL